MSAQRRWTPRPLRTPAFALAEQTSASERDGDAQAGRSGSIPSAASAFDDDEEGAWGDSLPEDHNMYASEPSSEFWQWRRLWVDEAPADPWTSQLRSEVVARIGDRLRAAVSLHQIDCRETICHLYLHGASDVEAQAGLATLRRAPVEVEHQRFADHVELEDAPGAGTTYEVIIRRDRPAWLPPHVPRADQAHRLALDALEATE